MIRAGLVAIAVAFAAGCAAAQDRLPIFDAHMHYSRPAWEAYDPAAVLRKLDAANVTRALVSSSPDDGTLALHAVDPARIVPILRPYREGVGPSNWLEAPDTAAYLVERLGRGVHRGIGEFHVADPDLIRTPAMRAVIDLAVEHDIVLHVHAGAAPVRALFEVEPRVKVLWAHAGLVTPPAAVAALMDEQERLWADLSFRAGGIAPGGTLDPVWRELLLRHQDRFMIGTDTYVTPRWAAYEALIEEHRRWLALLPRAVAEAIAYGNAARMFGE